MGFPKQLGNESALEHVFEKWVGRQNKQNVDHFSREICLDSDEAPKERKSAFVNCCFWCVGLSALTIYIRAHPNMPSPLLSNSWKAPQHENYTVSVTFSFLFFLRSPLPISMATNTIRTWVIPKGLPATLPLERLGILDDKVGKAGSSFTWGQVLSG